MLWRIDDGLPCNIRSHTCLSDFTIEPILVVLSKYSIDVVQILGVPRQQVIQDRGLFQTRDIA